MAGTRVVIDVDNVLYWRPPRSVATLTDLVRAVRERFGVAADIRLVATEAPTSDTAALREEATRAGAQLTLVPHRRGSSVDVVLAVQVMEAIPAGVERLVFASLDSDLVAVIPALKRAGIHILLTRYSRNATQRKADHSGCVWVFTQQDARTPRQSGTWLEVVQLGDLWHKSL